MLARFKLGQEVERYGVAEAAPGGGKAEGAYELPKSELAVRANGRLVKS
jgi:hypothetical protein